MSLSSTSKTIRELKRCDEILHTIDTDRGIVDLRREAKHISQTSTMNIIEAARSMKARSVIEKQAHQLKYPELYK